MLRLSVLLALLVACKDNSGTAHQVAPAPKPAKQLAEPPGGPPTCTDVAAHLAAALDLPAETHATVGGTDVAVSGDTMRSGMQQGIVDACRDAAWSHEARECAMGWTGNILSERAKLSAACPGTVK